MSKELPLVLVTGASSFIATHVVARLLAEKKYRVRGTVRDARDERNSQPNRFPEIELFSADLHKDDGWKEAVAGADKRRFGRRAYNSKRERGIDTAYLQPQVVPKMAGFKQSSGFKGRENKD